MGLDLSVLPESEFDSPLGTGSGAGAIFGATGGVMEAALRTAYELYTGKTLPRLEFDAVRGDINAIKEATIDLDGTPLKVAVANGLKNAEELIRRVERGRLYLHRDHGLPRRLYRRRRTAHRHQQRRPGRPYPGLV